MTLGERVTTVELCCTVLTVVGCVLTANPTLSLPSALLPHYRVGCLLSLLHEGLSRSGEERRQLDGT